MIDILWGYSKDICMISDVVWGKKSPKKDNDIYVQPPITHTPRDAITSKSFWQKAIAIHCNLLDLRMYL